MALVNLFPLSIAAKTLESPPIHEYQKMSQKIQELVPPNLERNEWFGDSAMHDCVHLLPEFDWLTSQVERLCTQYVYDLGYDTRQLSLFHHRSWLNLFKTGGIAAPHKHHSSNITFVYYFHKDQRSHGGELIFENVHYQNRIIPGLDQGRQRHLFREANEHNYTSMTFPTETGNYFIFPSNTTHLSGVLTEYGEPMIIITYDVMITTKLNVHPLKYEFIPPHPINYQEFKNV